jgi:hypothetical protein
MEMRKNILLFILASLLSASTGVAMACEYKSGETKFADYAKCRYGDDSVMIIDLPKDAAYENCVYHVQAFQPEKLLAVTKMKNGKEDASINDRTKIGNPCYLTKQQCDAALKTFYAENP